MEKAKKKILIIIGIILIVIAVLAYILSLNNDFEEDVPINPNNPDIEDDVFRDDIALLEDEAVYFGVQKIINDYYNAIFNEETSKILEMLDPIYKEENMIQANNLYSFIQNVGIANYLAYEIYYNPNSSVTYYFVDGSLSGNSVMGDDYTFFLDVQFVIIVDNDYHYVLKPIKTDNIFSFAQDYEMTERKLDSDLTFEGVSVSVQSKLSNYMAIFVNFLIDNPSEAYKLLSSSFKKHYGSEKKFIDESFQLYEKISSKIFSYSSESSGEENIYTIIDDKQNKWIIHENRVMDFDISIEVN